MDSEYIPEEEEDFPFFQWMEGDSLAPPCHSERDVIQPMLSLAEKHMPASFTADPEHAIFYDLGCGDGRVCLSATKRFGCRSVGVEIEDFLVDRFRAAVSRLQLEDKVKVVHGDLRELDFELGAAGTVITMYLLPEAIELIKDKLLLALRQGAVVVCNSWGMKDVSFTAKATGGEAGNVNFFLYTKDCLTNAS